ncbi:MAG: hypothetical protein AAGH92_09200 [Planctomycetota bacterium]
MNFRPVRLVGVACAFTLFAMLAGCTSIPAASELTPQQAWPIAREAYDRGYTDGLQFNLGQRRGTTTGDVGGLEGAAWSQGFDDATQSRPSRNDEQLQRWLDAERE